MSHIFNMATVTKYIHTHKKTGQKTVGTDRHPVTDWILGYSSKAGLSENRVLAAILAIGTS